MNDILTWIGIAVCVIHSGIFSGMNLAMFSLSRLSLEIAAENGSVGAARILDLRGNSNLILSTILWGNVGVNCLLTLLSESVLAGMGAFFFSTVGITVCGEIVPQAYFSRHAIQVGARLAPVLRFYQIVLYPVAKPSAMLLDAWLGPEGITYLRERDLKAVIEKHMQAEEADLAEEEGLGLLNYLALDDLPVAREGEPVDPASIIPLPVNVDLPVLPEFHPRPDDPFVERVQESGRKWVVLTDEPGTPRLVLDTDAFVRGVFSRGDGYNAYEACHRPIVVTDSAQRLGTVIPRLVVQPEHAEDDVVDHDLILVWNDDVKRIITGADLLGRILRGIATREGD